MYISYSEPDLPVKIEKLDYSIEEFGEIEVRPTTSNYIDDPDDPDYVDPDDNKDHINSNEMDYEEVEYLEIEDNKDALADRKLFLINIFFLKAILSLALHSVLQGTLQTYLWQTEYPDLEQQFLD